MEGWAHWNLPAGPAPDNHVRAQGRHGEGVSADDYTSQMSSAPTDHPRPSRLAVLAAYGALYVVWGSTYLAIHFAIGSLPPLLMASTRFLIAGSLLYAWMRLRGAPAPTPLHWRTALIVGGFLLLGGNGAVVWAEQSVPSGIAALFVAVLPLWMVLIGWAQNGHRPTGRVLLGIALGLAGVAVLVGPDALAGGGYVDPVGGLVLVLGSLCWALGSMYSRGAPQPTAPALGSATQMLAGGALLLVAGIVRGEPATFDPGAVTMTSLLALGYLIVAGSLIGFSAYLWLLRVEPPARVATYAFVNPVVAVFLGWALAGEPLALTTIVAATIIVASVALVVRGQPATPPPGAAGGTSPVVTRRAA